MSSKAMCLMLYWDIMIIVVNNNHSIIQQLHIESNDNGNVNTNRIDVNH